VALYPYYWCAACLVDNGITQQAACQLTPAQGPSAVYQTTRCPPFPSMHAITPAPLLICRNKQAHGGV
jgi:hypothetical protein